MRELNGNHEKQVFQTVQQASREYRDLSKRIDGLNCSSRSLWYRMNNLNQDIIKLFKIIRYTWPLLVMGIMFSIMSLIKSMM